MPAAARLVNDKLGSHNGRMSTAADVAPGRRYHHGDLREALLRAAAEEIQRVGPASLSLRALARALGVSHAAPGHHFADKRGLLTALAAEGHRLLAAAMREASTGHGGSFLEVGVAYVRFAVTHPAHFEVMFRPELHHRDDPELTAARQESLALLQGGAGAMSPTGHGDDPGKELPAAALAAWSLVHGLATLHASGNLPPGPDVEDLARAAAGQLFQRPPAGPQP